MLPAGFAWWLAAFSAVGGMQQGYCIGLVGGLLHNNWHSFNSRFPDVHARGDANEAKLFTFVFLLAAAVAASHPCAGQIADHFGRRRAILAFAYVALVGGGLMAAASAPASLYVGRGLSGVGVGGLSVAVPLYQSEVAPPQIRGRLLATFQMATTLGIMSAILAITFLEGLTTLPELGWRLALGLQTVPAAVLAMGIPFLPESPRWYLIQGREAAAKRALIRIRKSNSLGVLQELHEMKTYARHHGMLVAAAGDMQRHDALRRSAGRIDGYAAVSRPVHVGASCNGRETGFGADPEAPPAPTPMSVSRLLGLTCDCQSGGASKAPFTSSEVRGVGLAVLIFCFQQLSGINALLYYAPEILSDGALRPIAAVTSDADADRLAVLIVMGINCACTFFPVLLLDSTGRRPILFTGAVAMAATMVAMAILAWTGGVWGGEAVSSGGPISYDVAPLSFGILLLAFVGSFAASWGVVPWVVICELVPLRWHGRGVALAVSTNWTCNALVAYVAAVTPREDLRYLFLLFAFSCAAAAVVVARALPETRSVSLENVGSVFAAAPAHPPDPPGPLDPSDLSPDLSPERPGSIDSPDLPTEVESQRAVPASADASSSAWWERPLPADSSAPLVTAVSAVATAAPAAVPRDATAEDGGHGGSVEKQGERAIATTAGHGDGHGTHGGHGEADEASAAGAAVDSHSLLAVLVSFDVWLSMEWCFVLVLLTASLFDAVAATSGSASDDQSHGGETDSPPLFYTIFCSAVWAGSCFVTVLLLAMFFLREWALVLFLWKSFSLLSLLLTLLAFVIARAMPSTPSMSNIEYFLVTACSVYALFTCLLLALLWRIPRIRDHYRSLPTRPERPADTIGYLPFESFSFRRQDVIGLGGMARVYRGMYAGKMVAVKEVAAGSFNRAVCAEAALLANLRHPCVLHLYGCCAHGAHLYIVTELCDTSLHELLRTRAPEPLALDIALDIALQVAEGMQYLHSNGVAHRDLKPANILLSHDAGLTAKIGDFGLSRRTEESISAATALVGTIQYMAPEMLTAAGVGGEFSAAVDVYAFSIILWQLLTSATPYAAELEAGGRVGLLARIAREGLRPEVPPWSPAALSQLLTECWADAEHMRPTSLEVVRRLGQIRRACAEPEA